MTAPEKEAILHLQGITKIFNRGTQDEKNGAG